MECSLISEFLRCVLWGYKYVLFYYLDIMLWTSLPVTPRICDVPTQQVGLLLSLSLSLKQPQPPPIHPPSQPITTVVTTHHHIHHCRPWLPTKTPPKTPPNTNNVVSKSIYSRSQWRDHHQSHRCTTLHRRSSWSEGSWRQGYRQNAAVWRVRVGLQISRAKLCRARARLFY